MAKQLKVEVYQLKEGKEEITIIFPELRKMLLLTRALEHELRKKMVNLLAVQKKMTVTELYVKLKVEQSVASQHLAVLRRSGVVSAERNGKNIYYTLNKSQLDKIAAFVSQIAD
jgi:DNA-binding transcriptional ArsR family regulator